MRLLFFADLHLDTAFTWASREVAQRRRQNLRDTLSRIVRLAEEIDADALLIAGDLYEQERFTPDTQAFLRNTLGSASTAVYIAPGNHDWYGRSSLYAQVDWPAHVHIFTESSLEPVELDDGLTLWGSAHCAPANTDGFFDSGFQVGWQGIHLGLFHGSERSAMQWQPEGKVPHAPFTEKQVQESGLHHAFCGHYHVRREERHFTYPGSPDPLTFGDSLKGGAVEVEVHGDGSISRTWHSVRISELHNLTVDISGSASMQDVLDAVTGEVAGLSGCARIILEGEVEPSLELDVALLERDPQGLEALVVRPLDIRYRYDLAQLAHEQTVRGQFVRDVQQASDLGEDERRRILITGLRALDGRRDLEVV